MSKKNSIIALIIIAILGSLVAYYTSNLFFADVPYFGAIIVKAPVFVSITGLMFGALMVTAAFYVVRLYKNPKMIKKLSSNYLIIAMALSFIGFLTALLAGIIHYGTLLAVNPFPGFVLIAMILHFLVLVCALFIYIKYVRALPEDEEKFKVTPKHVFYTLGWFLFVSLAFNRFGAFLFLPAYINFRNLGLTFVYYLFLLIPMAMLVKKGIDVFEVKYNKVIYAWALVAAILVTIIPSVIIGLHYTEFLSDLSPVLPLERLAAMPVETIIHVVTYLSMTLFWAIRRTFLKK